MKKEIRIYPRT